MSLSDFSPSLAPDPPRPVGAPLAAATSRVLDAARLGAAAVVVVFHASGMWTTAYPNLHAALGKASHAAVVVFFVISGYVIAYSAGRHHRGLRHYAVARLSRLYAVLAPTLLLTALVEAVIRATDPETAARYVHVPSGVRYLLSAVFGSEAGFWSAAPPINSPLWSLSYEFWYYVLFGLGLYRQAIRGAGWWLALAALLAGPKILLLLPVWLFGVGAWQLPRPQWAPGGNWLLAGLLLLRAALAVAGLPAWPGAVGDRPLYMAGQFLTDWVVGGLFAAAIWLLPPGGPAPASAGRRYLRRAADLSFPLYALHFPLLVLWRSLGGWQANDLGQLGRAIGGVSLLAGLLGWGLERQRGRWIRFFDRAIAWLARKGLRPRPPEQGWH